MPNNSSISEFLLLALADTRQLQLLHFWLLLGIYLAALLGNGLISTAVACDHRLHTPMYFFLLNLALLDLGCISTTLPKAMANALWHTRAISYAGCAAQLFFFVFFISAEYSLLTIMSYDRYVAICKPLHYGTLLGSRACATMAAAAWGTGQQHNTLFSFLLTLHCPTALKSLHLCRPEGLVCLTTALLSLQQNSGCAAVFCASLAEISTATAHLPQVFYHLLRILQLLGDEVPNSWGCPLL
uniref:G-protein coupled receptors family 1 profile domain-containing protein n=1 Tax=Gallus gallus TaxID=9031 RepID=A0A8V0XAA7_CHICK